MVKCLTWLFWTYLALKLIQLVFGGRRADFWEPAPGLAARLLRGEPTLFAVAFFLAVPAALATSWYLQRGYRSGLAHSADCYARLRALDALPAVQDRIDPYKLFRAVEAHQYGALLAGQALGLAPAAVTATLARRLQTDRTRNAALARTAGAPTLAAETRAARRCVQEPPLNL